MNAVANPPVPEDLTRVLLERFGRHGLRSDHCRIHSKTRLEVQLHGEDRQSARSMADKAGALVRHCRSDGWVVEDLDLSEPSVTFRRGR